MQRVMEELKNVNYEKMDPREREGLRNMAEKYQYFIQQFQDFCSNLSESQHLVSQTLTASSPQTDPLNMNGLTLGASQSKSP
jgi:uncharacterized damage-inducible protein DinB